jgi:hypothetical protein
MCLRASERGVQVERQQGHGRREVPGPSLQGGFTRANAGRLHSWCAVTQPALGEAAHGRSPPAAAAGRWESRIGIPGSKHIYLGLFQVSVVMLTRGGTRGPDPRFSQLGGPTRQGWQDSPPLYPEQKTDNPGVCVGAG